MRQKISFLLFAVWAGTAAAPVHAFVQVSPPIVEVKVDPNETLTGQLTVTNPGTESVAVGMDVKDWWQQQTGLPALPPAQWLKLSPDNGFTLAAKESRAVRYTVRFPPGWTGETVAMIFFNINAKSAAGGPMSFQLRHGIPIYAVASGGERVEAQVDDVTVRLLNKSSASALEFSVAVKNTGNIHLRPHGSAVVLSSGNPIDEAALAAGVPVFPGRSQRYFATTSKRDWLPGRYRASVRVLTGDMLQKNVLMEKSIDFVITKDRDVQQVP